MSITVSVWNTQDGPYLAEWYKNSLKNVMSIHQVSTYSLNLHKYYQDLYGVKIVYDNVNKEKAVDYAMLFFIRWS